MNYREIQAFAITVLFITAIVKRENVKSTSKIIAYDYDELCMFIVRVFVRHEIQNRNATNPTWFSNVTRFNRKTIF